MKKLEKIKDKKLKILAAGDFQGNPLVAESLSKKAERENIDLVILAGDIHGVRPAQNLISPFKKRNQKIIFVPGNWDTTTESNLIRDIYKINNIDGTYASYDGIDIIGIGCSDFRLNIDNQKTLDKLIKNFDKLKHKN